MMYNALSFNTQCLIFSTSKP